MTQEDNTYNGWTNYATWRINLEWFDDNSEGQWNNSSADRLKDWVVECLYDQGSGRVLDYALAFLDDVNWQEIAEAYTSDDDQTEEEDDDE